jgi:hypothetical protein
MVKLDVPEELELTHETFASMLNLSYWNDTVVGEIQLGNGAQDIRTQPLVSESSSPNHCFQIAVSPPSGIDFLR